MQEAMQHMSRKMKIGAKRGVEITLKREVQKEIVNPQPKMNTNQGKGGNCPYLGAKKLRSIYQVTQRTPRVFPKKYAKIV